MGGIKIPFDLGLEGHSDSDPVLHSIIDSLLGACRLGDIGKLFSNKNKKYKNIIVISNIFISAKNKKHVTKEANVPGAYFIFPIIKNVRKNKFNFLIILCYQRYYLRSYGFSLTN